MAKHVSLWPTLHVTIQDGKVEIVQGHLITPERSRRLHENIAELRIALDTEKQLKAAQNNEGSRCK